MTATQLTDVEATQEALITVQPTNVINPDDDNAAEDSDSDDTAVELKPPTLTKATEPVGVLCKLYNKLNQITLVLKKMTFCYPWCQWRRHLCA